LAWEDQGDVSSSLEISNNVFLSAKDFETIQLDWARVGGRH